MRLSEFSTDVRLGQFEDWQGNLPPAICTIHQLSTLFANALFLVIYFGLSEQTSTIRNLIIYYLHVIADDGIIDDGTLLDWTQVELL
jgi:hypothetical protein